MNSAALEMPYRVSSPLQPVVREAQEARDAAVAEINVKAASLDDEIQIILGVGVYHVISTFDNAKSGVIHEIGTMVIGLASLWFATVVVMPYSVDLWLEVGLEPVLGIMGVMLVFLSGIALYSIPTATIALHRRFIRGYSSDLMTSARRQAGVLRAIGKEGIYLRHFNGTIDVVRHDAIGSIEIDSSNADVLLIKGRDAETIGRIANWDSTELGKFAAHAAKHVPKVSDVLLKAIAP